jgi:hypothetical protein
VALRIRTVLTVFLVVVVGIGLGCYGAWLVFVRSVIPPAPPQPVCTARADGEASLRPEQMANAATIAAVGVRRGLPARAVQIALAAALQESKLVNLAGGDRDSVGLFQQRPSQGWGEAQQLADPRFAAAAFYHTLVGVRGWQAMDVGDAAQAVQRSAYPQAYLQWSDEAGILARALTEAVGGAVSCAHIVAGDQRGTAALGALTADFHADWGATVAVSDAGGAVTVTAPDPTTGWRYASWLVAYAQRTGVERVDLDGLGWTAGAGRWQATTPPPGGTHAVKARVFPAHGKATGR